MTTRLATLLAAAAFAVTGCQLPIQDSRLANLGRNPSPTTESATYLQRFAEARNLENAGELTPARKIYEALVKESPNRYEAVHRLAVVSDRQKRFREAQSLYRRAIGMSPDDCTLRNDYGYSLFLDGDLDAAVEQLTEAVRLDGQSARARNNLAMALGHVGRDQEALEQFLFCNSKADAHYNMAFVLSSRGDDEAAFHHYSQALAADPNHKSAAKAITAFQATEEQSDDGAAPVSTSRRHTIPFVEGEKAESRVMPASLPNARSGSVRRALHQEAKGQR